MSDSKRNKKQRSVVDWDIVDWHFCNVCQIARGGAVPKKGQMGITVMKGKCGICGHVAVLVPTRDYDWPKEGRKAWFD